MNNKIRIIFLNLTINLILFCFMFITIQNSSERRKINFLFFETIHLPISFIVTTSFITGAITGSILTISKKEFNDKYSQR